LIASALSLTGLTSMRSSRSLLALSIALNGVEPAVDELLYQP